MVDPIARSGGRGAREIEPGAPAEVDLRAQAFARELAGVLSSLDSVLGESLGLYASSERATGRHLYRVLAENGFHTPAELRDSLGEREFRRLVVEPWKARALEFSRGLIERHPEERVIDPARFYFAGWTPREYRTLWGTVLRTRVRTLHFGDDWEYGEGCCHDFKIAWEIGLPTFDADGVPISLSDGRHRIQSAMLELEADGFDTAGHAAALQNLGRQNRVAPAELEEPPNSGDN